MTPKRKKIEETIYKVIELLDNKEHYNLNKYKEVFSKMTDEEFGKFCEWCNDPNDLTQVDHTIFIQTMPFDEPSLENVIKGLEVINVPSEEYLYFPDFNNERPIRSRYRVPVGYLPIKRMEQLLSKKNRYSVDNEERSLKTDQVVGDSKVASISDLEANCLMAQGANDIFKEFYGPRSGDEKERNEMYKKIATDGYVSLSDIQKDTNEDSKVTLNTLNTYLLSAGYRSDLVVNSLKLPYTMKQELKGKYK